MSSTQAELWLRWERFKDAHALEVHWVYSGQVQGVEALIVEVSRDRLRLLFTSEEHLKQQLLICGLRVTMIDVTETLNVMSITLNIE